MSAGSPSSLPPNNTEDWRGWINRHTLKHTPNDQKLALVSSLLSDDDDSSHKISESSSQSSVDIDGSVDRGVLSSSLRRKIGRTLSSLKRFAPNKNQRKTVRIAFLTTHQYSGHRQEVFDATVSLFSSPHLDGTEVVPLAWSNGNAQQAKLGTKFRATIHQSTQTQQVLELTPSELDRVQLIATFNFSRIRETLATLDVLFIEDADALAMVPIIAATFPKLQLVWNCVQSITCPSDSARRFVCGLVDGNLDTQSHAPVAAFIQHIHQQSADQFAPTCLQLSALCVQHRSHAAALGESTQSVPTFVVPDVVHSAQTKFVPLNSDFIHATLAKYNLSSDKPLVSVTAHQPCTGETAPLECITAFVLALSKHTEDEDVQRNTQLVLAYQGHEADSRVFSLTDCFASSLTRDSLGLPPIKKNKRKKSASRRRSKTPEPEVEPLPLEDLKDRIHLLALNPVSEKELILQRVQAACPRLSAQQQAEVDGIVCKHIDAKLAVLTKARQKALELEAKKRQGSDDEDDSSDEESHEDESEKSSSDSESDSEDNSTEDEEDANVWAQVVEDLSNLTWMSDDALADFDDMSEPEMCDIAELSETQAAAFQKICSAQGLSSDSLDSLSAVDIRTLELRAIHAAAHTRIVLSSDLNSRVDLVQSLLEAPAEPSEQVEEEGSPVVIGGQCTIVSDCGGARDVFEPIVETVADDEDQEEAGEGSEDEDAEEDEEELVDPDGACFVSLDASALREFYDSGLPKDDDDDDLDRQDDPEAWATDTFDALCARPFVQSLSVAVASALDPSEQSSEDEVTDRARDHRQRVLQHYSLFSQARNRLQVVCRLFHSHENRVFSLLTQAEPDRHLPDVSQGYFAHRPSTDLNRQRTVQPIASMSFGLKLEPGDRQTKLFDFKNVQDTLP